RSAGRDSGEEEIPGSPGYRTSFSGSRKRANAAPRSLRIITKQGCQSEPRTGDSPKLLLYTLGDGIDIPVIRRQVSVVVHLIDVDLPRHLLVMHARYRVCRWKAFDIVVIRVLFDLSVLVLVERIAPL